jgi:superfamily II DNA or RNA helicase
VQTIARRGYPDADVVIVDECHLRFKAVSEWMHCAADKVFIGLSATPWAKGMGDDWQELITPVRMQELIDAGYLSPFRVYAPSAPDLSRVRMVAGDYHEGDLSEAVSNLPLIADIVETWKKHAVGLPTLVFAVNKAHAALLVRQFAAGGVQMGYCDDRVDPVERSYMFAQVRSGHLAGIVNIGTLTTGVDEDIRCIVLARPTRSQMLFVQMIGRGLRTAPGKRECVILDHADNHHRMGMVTDIYFPELLTGKDKPHKTASESGEAMPQACASCHFVKPPKTPICPSCGFKAERQSEIETEDGKLVEFKKPKAATMQDKQEFWSMALYVDRQRQKGGRLAKALYKSKFGVWPKNLNNWTCPPSAQFERYEHSRRIAFAKSRGA